VRPAVCPPLLLTAPWNTQQHSSSSIQKRRHVSCCGFLVASQDGTQQQQEQEGGSSSTPYPVGSSPAAQRTGYCWQQQAAGPMFPWDVGKQTRCHTLPACLLQPVLQQGVQHLSVAAGALQPHLGTSTPAFWSACHAAESPAAVIYPAPCGSLVSPTPDHAAWSLTPLPPRLLSHAGGRAQLVCAAVGD
jgi:hypothetical protein